jgi:heme-degrading monooxygenase HmoA
MNQVQEMPKLTDVASLPEAVERLSSLFEMMRMQPGFLSAEVLRNVATPETLLVLHAWRDLADWQTYQVSAERVAFTAGRPDGLYDMVPCGMNWRSLQADGVRDGGILRREVIQGDAVALRSGSGVEGCQTYVYQDDLPEYRGCTLRLTRLSAAGPVAAAAEPDATAIVDEFYESLVSVRASAIAAPAAGS